MCSFTFITWSACTELCLFIHILSNDTGDDNILEIRLSLLHGAVALEFVPIRLFFFLYLEKIVEDFD